MARGINKVILIGTCGADPVTRYGASGNALTTLSLATNESWTDKVSGEKQQRTEWHRVKLFGRLAEIASEFLRKGKIVYIEGKLRTEKFTDKEGVERYTTDVVADEMQLLGNPGGESGGERSEGANQQRTGARPTARTREVAALPTADLDDEIPF